MEEGAGKPWGVWKERVVKMGVGVTGKFVVCHGKRSKPRSLHGKIRGVGRGRGHFGGRKGRVGEVGVSGLLR